MKKPNKPVPMTVCSMRVIIRGELNKKVRWCSRLTKASGGHGSEVHKSG